MSMLWGLLWGLLKIIGILLLVILGLLLAVLLIVLLVSIRYRVEGARSPDDGVLTAKGKVSWLLSIFAVTFVYDQDFSWKIRICGIPLKQKEKDSSVEETVSDGEPMEMDLDARLDAILPEEPSTEDKPLILQTQEAAAERIDIEGEPAPAEKVSFSKKIRILWQKMIHMVRSLWEKLQSLRAAIAAIPEKVRSIKRQADTWIAFARSEEVKQLLRICRKQIRQILRHLLPTKLRIRGNFGFADPATTGQLNGILYMLPEKYQKGLQLQPHFDRECLDGELLLKGRIRLGSLLWPVIRIVVRPCTWRVYKRLKFKNDPHKGGK